MATVTNSTKRTSSTKKNTNGIKALIMAASVAITLGGWGILATGQIENAQASTLSTQASDPASSSTTQSRRSTSSSTTVNPFTSAAASANPIARTRSSR